MSHTSGFFSDLLTTCICTCILVCKFCSCALAQLNSYVHVAFFQACGVVSNLKRISCYCHLHVIHLERVIIFDRIEVFFPFQPSFNQTNYARWRLQTSYQYIQFFMMLAYRFNLKTSAKVVSARLVEELNFLITLLTTCLCNVAKYGEARQKATTRDNIRGVR